MKDLEPAAIVEPLGLVPLEPEGGFVGQTYRDGRASALSRGTGAPRTFRSAPGIRHEALGLDPRD